MRSRRELLTSAALLSHGRRAGGQPMFRNAEAYQRYMGRWSELLCRPFLAFSGVADRTEILDVGCGTGALSLAIAEAAPRAQVIGIDTSGAYVAYASKRNRHVDRVRFRTGDAQKLDFTERRFDACLSLLVFNFLPEPKRSLQEQRRVSRDGGILAAAVWDYGNGMQMLRAFWDAAVETDPEAARRDEKRMPLCKPGELSQLWKDAGLEQVTEQGISVTMTFDNFRDYWDPFLLGQGPAGAYAQTLPSQKLERLRIALKSRLGINSESSAFRLPGQAWAVRGVHVP